MLRRTGVVTRTDAILWASPEAFQALQRVPVRSANRSPANEFPPPSRRLCRKTVPREGFRLYV